MPLARLRETTCDCSEKAGSILIWEIRHMYPFLAGHLATIFRLPGLRLILIRVRADRRFADVKMAKQKSVL